MLATVILGLERQRIHRRWKSDVDRSGTIARCTVASLIRLQLDMQRVQEYREDSLDGCGHRVLWKHCFLLLRKS